jgi:hypothetical protein
MAPPNPAMVPRILRCPRHGSVDWNALNTGFMLGLSAGDQIRLNLHLQQDKA